MSWTAEQMCQRAAREVLDGCCVGLGYGVAPRVLQRVEAGRQFWWIDGMHVARPCQGGDRPPRQAGEVRLTPMEGLQLVRGGRLDLLFIRAEQVSEQGDLVMTDATGADIDRLAAARRVVVLMQHCRPDGSARIVAQCEGPLLGAGVVSRIITELGVIDVTPRGLLLVELAAGVSLGEISGRTGVALMLMLDDLPGRRNVADAATPG